MTLNVDLEEVPFAILEAVKARILVSRRRLQQQVPRPSLRPRPQRPRIGASSKSWRMPKEAAVVVETVRLGVASTLIESGFLITTVDGGYYEEIGRKRVVYSGNFKKSVEFATSTSGGYNYQSRIFLPVGGDVAIYVDLLFTEQLTLLHAKAFLVSYGNVREITLKGKMLEVIEIHKNDQNYPNNSGDISSHFFINSLLIGNVVTEHDAEIFQYMADAYQAPGPNIVKPKANSTDWLSGDSGKGYFAASQTDKNMYFQRFSGVNQANGSTTLTYVEDLPRDTIHATEATFYPESFNFTPSYIYGQNLHLIWDWDDPDYCRRMCMALGFSPADLTP